ncbi:MAG: helix-turn-helix domain-containing protein [Christensenella sp.]|nr:helix-turn-helix domain-containing protein [Christensenella sp.]
MNDYKLLIPELRAAMNVSQEDFAKILGVSPVSVSRWENGHSKPTKLVKVKLQKLFDRYDIMTEAK